MPIPTQLNPDPVPYTVTNTLRSRELTINKTAVGGNGTFTFDITCANGAGATVFTDTVQVSTSGGSGSTTATVPFDSTCTATETLLPAGFTLEGASGARPEASGSISFTNTATGSLVISKVQLGGPAGAVFTIDYTCTDGTSGSVTLSGGESETVSGIVAGSRCTVTETATGYTAVVSPAGAVPIAVGGSAAVTVTNTRNTTSLTINKTAVGGTGTFNFTVVCSNAAGESFSGSATVTVSTAGGSSSATVSDIPTGLDCVVTEADPGSSWSVVPADRTEEVNVGTTGGAVAFTNTKQASLTVIKFYDTNRNGVQDSGEASIRWQVTIAGTTYTIPTANPIQLAPGTYTVAEATPAGWLGTTPITSTVTLVAGGSGEVKFGNVCVGGTGGRTIGFWGNRNGQRLIGEGDLAMLRALNLVKADGTAFDPTTYDQLNTWLQAANATNMSYMLSAQLAAMSLNIYNGLVTSTALVWNGTSFVTIQSVVNAANAALGTDGLTPSGDSNRATQAALKDIIDAANNNRNFLSATPCASPF